MRHIKTYKLFESSSQLTQEQIQWIERCASVSWTLNTTTGLVDVAGDFNCHGQNLTDFRGVKFGLVGGVFNCASNNLTSLKGAPQHVEGDFHCSSNNNLTSLKGAPQHVEGDFNCAHNNLTSLEGAPQHVGGGFYCHNNDLTSLEGAPQHVEGNFYCDDNNLTSLEGAPQHVEGGFYCADNPVSKSVLDEIVKLMEGGISYQKAVEKLWGKIPINDKILLFRSDFGWIDPTERRELKALASVNRIKGMI
jgi:hypothetical protein